MFMVEEAEDDRQTTGLGGERTESIVKRLIIDGIASWNGWIAELREEDCWAMTRGRVR